MNRRLALFFDGTWNTRDDRTNVYRLYDLTASIRSFRGKYRLMGKKATEESGVGTGTAVEQIKYYHPGVGVNYGEKLLGGSFGYGLSRNIKDGYLWLTEHYQSGDEIFIFGFSRGAYTARSLVGLIRKCGIPAGASDSEAEALAEEAYHIYREKEWEPDGLRATAFKKTFSWPEIKVKFLGVWDTVGALGVPVHGIRFSSDYYRWHDTQLSRMVENAYHAVAMDEHRPDFAATMWSIDKKPSPGQTVEQRWFSGAHADVGGGYKNGKLQQIPLRWMQKKAAACGLEFTREVAVEKDAHEALMHDSLGEFACGLYAMLPCVYPYHRPLNLGVNESIDDSVWDRIESADGRDARGGKYSPLALRRNSRGNPPVPLPVTKND